MTHVASSQVNQSEAKRQKKKAQQVCIMEERVVRLLLIPFSIINVGRKDLLVLTNDIQNQIKSN